MIQFTVDWFSNNIGIWQKYLKDLKDKPIQVLEIGCFEGRATLWLFNNIVKNPKAYVTVIDTFEGSIEHVDKAKVDFLPVEERFRKNLKKYNKNLVILKGESFDHLRQMNNKNHFDIIYIDGSHQAVNVIQDAVLSFELLKKGGFVIFDDYEWNAYEDPTLNPKLAIDSFLSIYKGKYELIHKEYQVIIKKIV